MRDAKIGRLVPASLHAAIAELMPTRVEYYEAWLKPEELRRGSIAPAALVAVLGFLRQEPLGYGRIVDCAGRLASQWTLDLTPRKRRVGRLAPVWWRVRRALAIARDVTRDSYATARLQGGMGRKGGQLSLADSPFCDVRDRQEHALCGFYAAIVHELLSAQLLQATVEIQSCRARGEGACTLDVHIAGRLRSGAPTDDTGAPS